MGTAVAVGVGVGVGSGVEVGVSTAVGEGPAVSVTGGVLLGTADGDGRTNLVTLMFAISSPQAVSKVKTMIITKQRRIAANSSPIPPTNPVHPRALHDSTNTLSHTNLETTFSNSCPSPRL